MLKNGCSQMKRPEIYLAMLIILVASPALGDDIRRSLEAALASGNTQVMASILSSRPAVTDRLEIGRWLRKKIDLGQTPDSFVPLLPAILASQGDVELAVAYVNYYFAISFIDVSACPEISSGGSVVEAAAFASGIFLDRLNIDPAQFRVAVDRPIELEEATANLRRVDPSLCAGGLTPYSNPRQTPPPSASPDASGLRRQLWSPGGPLYRDDPTWRAKRRAILPNLRRYLLALHDGR